MTTTTRDKERDKAAPFTMVSIKRGKGASCSSSLKLFILLVLIFMAWLVFLLVSNGSGSIGDDDEFGRNIRGNEGSLLSLRLSSSPNRKRSSVVSDSESSHSFMDNATTTTTTTIRSRLVQRGVPPLSCSDVLHKARNGTIIDPNEGKLYVRYTSEEPHFYISVHTQSYDSVRFQLFDRDGFYYERTLTECFRQVLSMSNDDEDDDNDVGKSKSSSSIRGTDSHRRHRRNRSRPRRVLDVGGNIGWYTLLSAALGAQVATFEPHQPNYLRMCESLCLNHWSEHRIRDGDVAYDGGHNHGGQSCLSGSSPQSSSSSSWIVPEEERILIFPYGISNVNETLHFEADGNNPGQGRVVTVQSQRSIPLRVVPLDDMVQSLGWTTGVIDILKVDVEGAERNVFMGATELLKSNRVQNIFMEGNVRWPAETIEFRTLIELFMDSGYYLYKIGGFSGPSSTTDVPNVGDDKTKFADELVTECGKNPAVRQCNLWWKVASGNDG